MKIFGIFLLACFMVTIFFAVLTHTPKREHLSDNETLLNYVHSIRLHDGTQCVLAIDPYMLKSGNPAGSFALACNWHNMTKGDE